MRPYLDAASIYLCPIRTGGGTRLKVLDAFAMGKPLVATKLAVEGLGLTEGEHYLRAESAGEFVTQIERLEGNESLRRKLAAAGRALVEERFSWEVIGAHLQGAYLSAAHLDAARVAS